MNMNSELGFAKLSLTFMAIIQNSKFRIKRRLSLFPLESVAEAEDACGSEACDDMPDAPPCGDDEHTSILQLGREDVGIEEEDEAETRVLDTHLDGDGPTVGSREA